MKMRLLEPIMVALCLSSQLALAQARDPALQPLQALPATDLIIVEIAVNGELRPGQYAVVRRGEDWLLKADDLSLLRIDGGAGERMTVEGDDFVVLPSAIAVRFDTGRQRLELTVPSELFPDQKLIVRTDRLQPTQGALAAFLNYDLSVEYHGKVRTNGYVEAGLSDDWGLFASTMVIGRDLGAGRLIRLDSYYLRDDPGSLTRLVVGDTVTASLDWSRQARFGGVRLGTEFGLQPDLVTFPTPAFAGRTTLPTNVELLVNDVSRFQGSVDQGPFSINQVPLVTGAGQVTIVLRDALGVQRRVRTSYYVSPRLLTRGLAAWSLELGAERRDYGLKSFDYRNPFLAGSYRRGLLDWMTVEARAEAGDDVRMTGAGVSLVWAPVGEFGLAGAASQGRDGKGGLYRFFYSRVSQRWNVAISYQRASRHFDQLGIDRDQDRITRQLQASAGLSLDRGGNVALGWTDLRYADGNRARLASANYTVGIGTRAFVNLYAIRSDLDGAGQQTTVGFSLTLPMGARTSAYAQVDSRNQLAEVRQTTPVEGGWGYRLAAGAGDSDRQQAELRWRGNVGEMSLEAARLGGEEGLRFLASGGFLFAGGGVHATRRIEGGFGVVEVPGQANVRIYQENRLVARTDASGRAVIPDLRPYEANRISLAPSDLPLDTSMPADRMIVVPRYRGSAAARFAVEREAPATIIVFTPDGKPVEIGASVVTDDGAGLFVGQGGEIFVPHLGEGIGLVIDTAAGPCRVKAPAVPAGATLPRIGPLVCVHERGAGR